MMLSLYSQHRSKTKAIDITAHTVNMQQYTTKELDLLEELLLSFESREHK
jgi:hypothetical protein